MTNGDDFSGEMPDRSDGPKPSEKRGAKPYKRREKKPPKPLTETKMRDLALHYVGRYATTAHKLKMYLGRKLRERGWEGERSPDIEALVARFVELKYIDDALYASQKAASLTARGYGSRRVGEALYVAGISDKDGKDAKREAENARVQSALKMARKRRFGPFAREAAEPDKRQKQLQAMLRGGHDFSIARRIVFADSMDEIADLDDEHSGQEDYGLWHD